MELTKELSGDGGGGGSGWASSHGLGDLELRIAGGNSTPEDMAFMQQYASVGPEAGAQSVWNNFVTTMQDRESGNGGILGIKELSTGIPGLDKALGYAQGMMWGGNTGGALATGGDPVKGAAADLLTLGGAYVGGGPGTAATATTGGAEGGALGAGLNASAGGAAGITAGTPGPGLQVAAGGGGALSEASLAQAFPGGYSALMGGTNALAPNPITGQVPQAGATGAPAGATGLPTAPAPAPAPAAPGGYDLGGGLSVDASGAVTGGVQGLSGTGAASGGAGGVNGILQAMRQNATLIQLGLSGGALALAAQGRHPEQATQAQQQLQQMATQGSDVAKQLLASYTTGQLSAGQQTQLEQLTQQTKNQVRNYFASIGQSDSTAAMQAMAQVDQQATAMKQAMLDNMLTQGLQAMGLASGALGQVTNYQLGQDKNLMNAFGTFANAIGRSFGTGAGQGTPTTQSSTPSTPTPPQSPYPDNAGGG